MHIAFRKYDLEIKTGDYKLFTNKYLIPKKTVR